MSEDTALERRETYYSGRVQGVGFRYTVRMLAQRFDVTGFVKNLPDGRVQLVAEGRAEEVQGLLRAVAGEMGRYVAEVQAKAGPATGAFDTFDIRF